MNSVINDIPQPIVEDMMLWFAKQDNTTKKTIFRKQHFLFQQEQEKGEAVSLPWLAILCLYAAIKQCGWQDEKNFRTGKMVSDKGLKAVAKRRRQRSLRYRAHRDQIRVWLKRHWGIVHELRREGLSWRGIARMILDEYGIDVSHTTLIAYWRKYHENYRHLHSSRDTSGAF